MEIDNNEFFEALRQEREYKQALDILKKDKEEEEMSWKNYESNNSIPSSTKLKLTNLQEAKANNSVEKPRAIDNLEADCIKALLGNEGFMYSLSMRRSTTSQEMGDFIKELVQTLLK